LEPLYQQATVPSPKTNDRTPIPAFLNAPLNRTREGPDFHPEKLPADDESALSLLAGVDIAVGRIMVIAEMIMRAFSSGERVPFR